MTIAGDEANLSVSLEDVSLRQCHVAGIRFEDFDLVTHGGPYEGPQMPIKTFNNVTIADAPHGYYVQDTFLTPLPGEATFENVPSNFVLLSSYQDTPEPRRLAKTSIPWETQGFTADGTIVVEAGVELVIRDEACQFDNLCSNGDFSYGNGELRLLPLQRQRGPEPEVAAADDGHVDCPVAGQRLRRLGRVQRLAQHLAVRRFAHLHAAEASRGMV